MRDEVLRGFTALLLAAREVVVDYSCSCDDPNTEHCSYDDLKAAVSNLDLLLGEVKSRLELGSLSWFEVSDGQWKAGEFTIVRDRSDPGEPESFHLFNTGSKPLGSFTTLELAMSTAETHRVKSR